MFKKLIATAALLLSMQAHATVISVNLDQNQYNIGDTIKASLVVSDIQTLVSGFEASLHFNQKLVELQDVAFGSFLTLDGISNIQDKTISTGKVFLNEVFLGFALEDLIDLAALQPKTNFVLATFSFKALTNGTSLFGLRDLSVLYSPSDSPDYQDVETRGQNATAIIGQPVAVSAPATIALLLPALFWLRRRQH